MAEIVDYQKAVLARVIRDNEDAARRILRALQEMRSGLASLASLEPELAELVRHCETEASRLQQMLNVSERCRAAAASGDIAKMAHQRDLLVQSGWIIGASAALMPDLGAERPAAWKVPREDVENKS